MKVEFEMNDDIGILFFFACAIYADAHGCYWAMLVCIVMIALVIASAKDRNAKSDNTTPKKDDQ